MSSQITTELVQASMETTPAVQVDAATGTLSDNVDIASTDANESNASAPPQTQQGENGAGTQSERPARVREVSPRSLSEMVNGQELIYGILCGVEGMRLLPPDICKD